MLSSRTIVVFLAISSCSCVTNKKTADAYFGPGAAKPVIQTHDDATKLVSAPPPGATTPFLPTHEDATTLVSAPATKLVSAPPNIVSAPPQIVSAPPQIVSGPPVGATVVSSGNGGGDGDGDGSGIVEDCDNKACCDIKKMTGVAAADPVCQSKYFGAKATAKKAAAQKAVAKSKEWSSHVQGDLFLSHAVPQSALGYKMKDYKITAIKSVLHKVASVSPEQVKLLNIHLPPGSAGYVTELTFSITIRRSSADSVMAALGNVEHSKAFRDKFAKDLEALVPDDHLIAASVSHIAFLDANPDTPSPTPYHFPTPVPTTATPTTTPTTPTSAPTTLSPTLCPTKEPTRKKGELQAHVSAGLADFTATFVPTFNPTTTPTVRTENKLVIQVALLGEDIHNWWGGSLVRKKFRKGLADATHVEKGMVDILGVHADPNVKLGVVVDTEVRVMKQRELTLIQSVETVKFTSLLSSAFARNAFDVPASKISVGVTFGDLSRVVVTEDKISAGGAIPGAVDTSTLGLEDRHKGKAAATQFGPKTIKKLRYMLLSAGIILMMTFGACSGVVWQTMRQAQKKRSYQGIGGVSRSSDESIPLKQARVVPPKQAPAKAAVQAASAPAPAPKSYFSSAPAKSYFSSAPAPAPNSVSIGIKPAKAPIAKSSSYDSYADDDDDLASFEFDDCMADDLGQEVI